MVSRTTGQNLSVSYGPPPTPPPALDVRALLATLRRSARWIVGTTLICAVLALAFILIAAPKYTASGRILLDPAGLQIVGTGIAPQGQGTADTSAIEAESQIYVVTSRNVFDRVIERENLETDPLFGGRRRGLIGGLFSAIGLGSPADARDIALRQLDRAVIVTRNPGSFVVTVGVRTEDRDTSMRVANAIMEIYMEDEARARSEAARRAGSSLDGRLDDLRARVREAEDRYERYRADNGIVTTGGQPLLERQLDEVSTQLTGAKARVGELRSALDQIRRVQSGAAGLDAMPEALRTGTIETLRTRYAAARQAEADLAANLGPRHPDRASAAEQTEVARRLMEQEIGNIVRATAAEMERARAVETGLETRRASIEAELARLNEASVEMRELSRDVEASRAIYEAFLTRSRELGEQEQLNASNTRIISRAVRPLDADGPSPILILLASIVLGLGIGVSLAWLREQVRAGTPS